jgi:hypothetical protein
MLTMPEGTCALCRQLATLQKSHLIPQGIYKWLKEPDNPIRNPVLVTASTTVQSNEQASDYLLCRKCEVRFQQNGEEWLMRNGPRKGRFPLRDALCRSPNKTSISSGDLYKEPYDSAFNLESLIYFAASVFWRSSVHHWRGFEHLMSRAKLPERLQEQFRLFLLHEDQFPTDVALLISITATQVYPHLTHPSPMQRALATTPELAGFAFMIPGLQFRLHCENVPEQMKAVSVALPPHAILVTDRIEQEIRTSAEKLRSTSKVVGSLTRLLRTDS